MAKATALALAASSVLVMVTGCSDASSPGFHRYVQRTHSTEAEEEPLGYGWSRPITTANFGAAAATKLGKADATLAGNSLREIVTSEAVRVRGDNRSCTSCHEWASGMTRKTFCARIPAFVSMPTAKGDGTDPENAKPTVLKELLQRWYDDECPE